MINNEITIEKEVNTTEGTQILIKLAPYMDKFNTAQGCVIALTDISQMKILKNSLEASYAELKDIMSINFTLLETPVDILIIDDNEVDLLAIKTAFNTINKKQKIYNIYTVSRYDDVAAFIKNQNVDLCLVDYNLGRHTGVELIKELKKHGQNLAFILFSGLVDDEIKDSAIQLGIFDVIDKATMTPELLEVSIKYSLRHKKTEAYLNKLV